METVYFVGFDVVYCFFSELILKTVQVPFVVSYLQTVVVAMFVLLQGVTTIHYTFSDLSMMLHPMVFAMAAANTVGTAFQVASMASSSVFRVALLGMTEPLYVVCIEMIVYKRTLGFMRFVGILTLLFGMVFLLPPESVDVTMLSWQVFYCNIANFAFATRSVMFKHLCTHNYPGKPTKLHNTMLELSAVQYMAYWCTFTMVLGVGYRGFFDGLARTGLREGIIVLLSSFSLLVTGLSGARLLNRCTAVSVSLTKLLQTALLLCVGAYIEGAQLSEHYTYGIGFLVLGALVTT